MPVVVVGPPRPTSRSVTLVLEDPVGSGPAAALAAGVGALDPALPGDTLIAVLAADLPAVTGRTMEALCAALTGTPDDGAVLVDAAGREQLLLAVWRHGPLVVACQAQQDWAGVPLRRLLAPLSRLTVTAVGDEAADIDTPDDLDRWERQ